MIKLVRYNKGVLMSITVKMQLIALSMIICFPILLGELRVRLLKNMDELIYAVQSTLMGLGVVGYLLSFAIMIVVLFAYKPINEK